MLRQYHAQRFRPSLPMIARGRRGKMEYVPQESDFGYRYRVGTVPVGTIVYLQDGGPPGLLTCRNPWIVTAWLNREYYPCVGTKPRITYCAGGHLALVRSLREGRTQPVSEWMLLACTDAGLERS